MKRLLLVVGGLVCGLAVGIAAGFVLVEGFSSNVHDRGLEAAMTAFFVTGPIGALAGAVFGALKRIG